MPAGPSLRKMLGDTVAAISASPAPVTLAPGQIPSHRSISFGGELLALSINLAERKIPHTNRDAQVPKTCRTLRTLHQDLHDLNRTFFDLVSILNRFTRVAHLEVIFRMPFENFTQLIDASHFYRLDFQDWKLFTKVGSEDLEQIHVGTILERRLNGWYKINIAGIP
ncbi:hypothetical protein sscle_05g041750 [Sclerotinia sclerotiorum 1980 UF-70]|uniref:Uncharacterized protein n=1 Tax=Sclerotinia sclerotiorum (strain ATCC 18683 / 1980 / Ss-1) TaxID=665079 RepID=A0A1D9Q381_SCLS1|nr:hypothetical protein sscle_05g041750 [Sclerotinia sclerotiorum 1980 UF-70]